MKKMILALFVLSFIIVGVLFLFRETPKSINQDADFIMDARIVLDEFEHDEKTAKQKYQEKVMEITGIVNSVETVKGGINLALSGRENLQTISCNIDSSIIESDLFKLNGHLVTVKGRFGGYIREEMIGLKNISLVQCSISQ